MENVKKRASADDNTEQNALNYRAHTYRKRCDVYHLVVSLKSGFHIVRSINF